jgi:hypothetical protein
MSDHILPTAGHCLCEACTEGRAHTEQLRQALLRRLLPPESVLVASATGHWPQRVIRWPNEKTPGECESPSVTDPSVTQEVSL